ncbi:maleylpyruvate isomerase family mycothiol-dependent enzyme [Amycolatopsis sp. H20-H5]|uniref:maleylpyruvate isomerase family mycothiol-dependent enzyme n=1 Tax=Amycolatopsis sp. H20-H5 TaxID=3046309 RepID=UPI002DB7E751|nr:maleylpyruvate isomerase family mycothiol-dependent enzyme [Amycolatopsis sp. H20-H5]MEC3979257.1 maleylpyruvate isomerase family mycothiol-dependent enzyme [Amycolatopsis sp. H20-H5]
MDHDRYCTEIVAQTALLRATIQGADMTVPVPSCPGWNVGQLGRHLGGGQRWAAATVRSLATEPPADHSFRDLSAYTREDPAVLGPWLAEGAEQLAEALRDAGPRARVWTPFSEGGNVSAFWARRFTHETVIHRSDATLALGAEYTLDADLAIDGFDEWMELGTLPMHFEVHPWMRELLGEGRTLHFHATDAPGEWSLDLTGDVMTWRRGHEKAAVAVRGPLTELLLLIYKRRPVENSAVEVFGDAKLLDFWLERVSFG